ncbi:MAG: hypothetical protein ACLP36_17095 [Acidimicrobiales bacterium]|jgi:hypothetical protein
MRSISRKIRLLSAGAAAGLTLGVVGTSGAAMALSGHAVTACSTVSDVLKLEQANGKCPSGSSPVSIGAKGATGATGPKGATGARGATGAPGQNYSAANEVIVTAPLSADDSDPTQGSPTYDTYGFVTCPPAEPIATGGGVTTEYYDTSVNKSDPTAGSADTPPTGWEAETANSGAYDLGKVYAICSP